MALVLTEEQELLQNSARDFVGGRSSLRRVRELRDSGDQEGFSRQLWTEMASLGWLGIAIPEIYGGAGLGYTEVSLVMEELGKGLLPEPMLSTVLLGGTALLLGGTEEQRAEHLPALVAGERLFALAYQERRSRHHYEYVETRAQERGAGWTIQGEKVHVLDGHAADFLILSARTDGTAGESQGITLFLLASGTPGVTIEPQTRVDGRKVAVVHLQGVQLGKETVLGGVGGGGDLLARTIARATIGLAAEMLGSMTAAFEMTLDYLKTRVQFGVPIGSFQALKHRAVQMYIEMELSRSAVMAAGHCIDDGGDDGRIARAASIAKARCSDSFVRIGNEGIQMHGGIGMTDEHDIGLFFKRARAAEMTFGDAAYHRDQMARVDGY